MNGLEQTLQNNHQNSDALAVPTLKHEDWKYTNLNRLWDSSYPESTDKSQPSISGNIVTITDLNFSEISLNGMTIREASSEEINTFKTHSGYFKEGFLSKLSELTPLRYMTIEQTESESSAVIMNFIQSAQTQGHLAVICTNSTDLKMFFKFEGEGQLIFHNYAEVDQNKSLEQVILNQMDELFMIESHTDIQRDGRYSQVLKHEGQGLNRANIAARLLGENAECDVHGLMTPNGAGHVDTCGYIEHAAPHTYSRQVYKSILGDNAKGIFAGKVKVNKDCLLIEAEQLNKNLLLTEKAQAFSRPQMEIDADDVKCAHGSTTGQMSEQELFYFESRGIRKDKARQMLAQGFAMDVILKIKDKTLRDHLTQESKC